MRGNNGSIVVGPWTIDVEQEIIQRETGERPDERWRYLDRQLHGHYWKDGYPTLERVGFECDCSAIEEPHTDWRWECPHCGEVIRPDTLPSRPEAVAGRLTVRLRFEDRGQTRLYYGFTDEEGRAIINDPIEAIPRLTAHRTPDAIEYRGG